jgi:Na+-driven multidrug efflux pump
MWLIRPPFALSLMPGMGADAIWWSFPLGSLASMLMAMGYYRWGGWRKAHMLSKSIPMGDATRTAPEVAPAAAE